MAYMVIAVLTIFSTVFFVRSMSEARIAKKYYEDTQALWLSEAGLNRALIELRATYISSGSNLNNTDLGPGRYYWNVTASGYNRTVTSHGIVPASGIVRSERILQAVVYKAGIPSNFFDNAVYSAGTCEFDGNSYDIYGNVIYAQTLDAEHNKTHGNITHDPSINPLVRLDFEHLYNISLSQGNVFNSSRLENASSPMPTSFWYNEAAHVPNVVYVTTDLSLSGKKLQIGGFIVVVGNVISDSGVTADTTLTGNVNVSGCIYTTAALNIDGTVKLNGGVWGGDEVDIKGNCNVTYNATYMSAISNLTGANATAQVISWRDLQNPYH